MEKEIKKTWHFNQAPQDVWEYLTKPELIEQWLMKIIFSQRLVINFNLRL